MVLIKKKTWRKTKNTVKKVAGFVNRNKGAVVTSAGLAYQAYKVAQLAAMINAEKKRFTIGIQNVAIGQMNGASANGNYAVDVTPVPAQGTTSITRNGNSIKLCSSFYKFQVTGQSARSAPMKLRFLIVKVKGNIQTPATMLTNIMSPNNFITGSTIYDFNSDFNPDFFSQYTIVKNQVVTLAAENYAAQVDIKTFSFGLKYGKNGQGTHVRFTTDGSIILSEGQMILMIFCDSGNMSSSVVSTDAGIPVTAINTGATFSMNAIHYYYDN